MKRKLRARYKVIREGADPFLRSERDAAVFERLVAMPLFIEAKTLLIYVSTPAEVDTHRVITHALSQGRVVAVPRCYRDGRMDFYPISSLEELVSGTLGILEPAGESGTEITDFRDSICLVPGLCFDLQGYRLGYGGGYYDRFLSRGYDGVPVGISYQSCVCDALVHEEYDMPCRWLVTENHTLFCPDVNGEGRRG